MILLGDKQIGYDSDKINRLCWDEFEELAKLIAKDINDSSLGKMKICLLGVARGGLPLLTYVSHHTGIRDVSIVQAKMTKSDNPFDYGKTKVFLEAIREEFEEFILLEDIVYKGNTVKEIIDILTKNGKKVHSIYSLVIDESYSNESIPMKIKSASIIRNEAWVKFPWEKKEID